MNLIFLRNHTPKAKKFIKKKLRAAGERSIYGIEAGDCCFPPADPKGGDFLLTFLNDMTPEMMNFVCRSNSWTAMSCN